MDSDSDLEYMMASEGEEEFPPPPRRRRRRHRRPRGCRAGQRVQRQRLAAARATAITTLPTPTAVTAAAHAELQSRARTSDCRRSSTRSSESATSCMSGCGRCSTRRKHDTASRRRAHHPKAANNRTPVHHRTLTDRRTKLADRNPGGNKRPVATSLDDAGKPTTASPVQRPRLLRALRSWSRFWTSCWRSIPWTRWNFDILLVFLLVFFCDDLLVVIY